MSSPVTAPAKKRAKKSSNQAPVPSAKSAADFRGEILKLKFKLEKMDSWDSKRAGVEQAVRDLRSQLEVAELNEMPIAPRLALAFREAEIQISLIEFAGNHREAKDELEIRQLSRSIALLGQQQHIGVLRVGDGPDPSAYRLIWGNRRVAAIRMNGGPTVLARIYDGPLTPSDIELLRTADNFGHKSLTPIERAVAIARNLEALEETLAVTFSDRDFGGLRTAVRAAGGNIEYLAQRLGLSPKAVKDHSYLARLGGTARQLFAEGRLGTEAARELAKLGDPAAADDIARSAARGADGMGGRSIDWTRAQVSSRLKSLRVVPWKLDVAFGSGVAGCTGNACASCPFNSKSDPDLFGGAAADQPEAGVCTHGTCFDTKTRIAEKLVKGFIGEVKKSIKDFGPNCAAITEAERKDEIPMELKPSSAIRAARKMICPGEPAAGKSPSNGSAARLTPKENAQRAFDEARHKWGQDCIELVTEGKEGAASRPGSVLAFYIAELFPIRNWHSNEESLKESKKSLESIFSPGTLKCLAVVEKILGNRIRGTCGPPVILARWLALWWKIELPAEPQVEDFLPGPNPQKDDAGEAE